MTGPSTDTAAGTTVDASDPLFYTEANRPAYLHIHADDPVYWVEAEYTQPFWNVCRHELIRQVGQDGELFTTEFGVHLNAAAFDVKRDLQSSSSLTAELPVALRPANIMDAAGHRRLRVPINQHFRPAMAAQLEPAIRAEIRDILDAIEPGQEADFMRAFASREPHPTSAPSVTWLGSSRARSPPVRPPRARTSSPISPAPASPTRRS